LTVDIFYPERRLTVEDNAGGIDPTLGERLFLPYTSSKPIKLNTGLGLYQAREAMELMQGYLILSEHQPAGGTRFELSLTVRETI
jgi:signal transduction histidine kinase